MVTEAWTRPSALGRAIPLLRRLVGRYHEQLANAPVESAGAGWLALDTVLRTRRQFEKSEWPLLLSRNQAFDAWASSRVARALDSASNALPQTLFAYSYACTRTLEQARQRNAKVLLGQIDGGPHEEELVLAEQRRYPHLNDRYRPAPSRYWNEWRRQCEYATRIVVNSQWALECLSAAGIPTPKMALLPLYFEAGSLEKPSRRTRAITPENPLKVLFLGQVNLRKGMARLLEGARLLRGRPVEFWIVGPLQISIPKEVAGLSSVRIFGAVDRARVADFYRRADVFILPTLSDGFAITQLEAQAFGLPVIASKHCGEVVRHGVNGLVLEEITGERIADSINSLANQPELMTAMSQASNMNKSSLEQYAIDLIRVACFA